MLPVVRVTPYKNKALEVNARIGQLLPARVDAIARRRFLRTRARILQIVRVEPPKVGSPTRNIRWSSRKQQRAFHASDGFGAGIPHERSHDYINAFDVVMVADGGRGYAALVNDNPVVPFMPGNEQEQPFLVDAGWLNVRSRIAEERPEIALELGGELMDSIDPFRMTEFA